MRAFNFKYIFMILKKNVDCFTLTDGSCQSHFPLSAQTDDLRLASLGIPPQSRYKCQIFLKANSLALPIPVKKRFENSAATMRFKPVLG